MDIGSIADPHLSALAAKRPVTRVPADKTNEKTPSRHIMNGDKVSNADMRYLMENNFELYEQATLLKQQNKTARERDSVSEEEKTPQPAEASAQAPEPAAAKSADEASAPPPEAAQE